MARALRISLTHQYCWPEVRRGGERYLHELAASLQRAGHAPQIISSAPRPAATSELDVPVRLLKRRSVGRRGPEAQRSERAFALAALPVVTRAKSDVWHALGTADGALAASLSRWHPRLASAYTELGIPAAAYRLARTDAASYKRIVGSSNLFFCLSEDSARRLKDDFGRAAELGPGGVDVAKFRRAPRDPRPTILYSGTLSEPRKRVVELLGACVSLRRAVPDLQVWLSGPGDAAAVVAQVPGAEAIVTSARLDPFDELVERYGRAWCTVLPSEQEAQGLVVLESLACGTPVVVLSGGAPAEMLSEGAGVAADGLAGLETALLACLDLSVHPETPDRCLARARDFDWDSALTPKIVEAYHRALAR